MYQSDRNAHTRLAAPRLAGTTTFMTLLWLVSATTSACTFSDREPETFLPSDALNDAGRAHESSDSTSTAPSASDSGGEAASGGMTTANAAGKGSRAATSGSGASAPSGGAGASADALANAGGGAGARSDSSATRDADASVPVVGELPADPGEAYACAAALTLCLIDFANYTECVRMSVGPCGLPDGGVTIPSPECAQRLSDCVQQHPERAQECNEMLATCR